MKKRRFSLSRKLLFMFGLLMASTIILLVVAGLIGTEKIVMGNVEAHLKDKSGDTAQIMDLFIKNWFEYMKGIAKLPALQSKNLSYTEKAKELEKLLATETNVRAFALVDLHGIWHLPDGRTFDVSKQDWFLNFTAGNTNNFSEPFTDLDTGDLICTVAVPILDKNNTMIDILEAVIDGYVFCNAIDQIVIAETGNAYITNKTGDCLAHVTRDKVKNKYNYIKGKDSADGLEVGNYIEHILKTNDTSSGRYHFQNVYCIASANTMKTTGWHIIIQAPINEFLGSISHLRIVVSIVGAAILLVSVCIVAIFSLRITKPIVSLANALKNIAQGEGDLTVNLAEQGNDEITDVAIYFNETIQKIGKTVKAVGTSANKMQEIGDALSTNMTETASAINQINSNIENLNDRALEQSTSVTETSATMEEIIRTIEQLNKSIEVQATSVMQSSASVEQMVHGIASITDQLKQNNDAVSNLHSHAQNGKAGTMQANSLIQKVSEKSDLLHEAAKIIQSIASQTNLLAMNASIEAAHAGDAGKGFAVVANEIRKLAEESNQQGKQIGDMIKETLTIIQSMSEAGKLAENIYMKIYELSDQITEREHSLLNAMQEQDRGNREVLEAIKSINEVTNEVKMGSSEMLNGGRNIATEMSNLDTLTVKVKSSVGEMTAGLQEITDAVHEVQNLTITNKAAINLLNTEVHKFKV